MKLHFQQIKPKTFEFRNAIDSVWGQDVAIETPGVYQIIASSGSGKSTLVSILSGLRGDYDGELKADQTFFSAFRAKDWSIWRSTTASFVFQDLRLFPELTALANIELSKELHSKVKADIKEIERMATVLGVHAKLQKPVKQLSYGQMQRIAIIRALSRDFQWLILDEPFSHLDLDNAQNAWSLILDNARAKKAGIIITSLDPYPFINPDKVFIL